MWVITPFAGTQLLITRYNDILQSLPNDYMMVLDVVQDHLSDDQICEVLTSTDSVTANTKILDCLKEDLELVNLCDVLEQIAALLPNPTNMLTIIGEIRASNECFYGIIKFLWVIKTFITCSYFTNNR